MTKKRVNNQPTTLHIVATVINTGPYEDDLIGDVILITPDEQHAKSICYSIKEKRPLPGIDYNKLVTFDDCFYFSRTLDKLLVNNQDDTDSLAQTSGQ